MPVSRRGFLRLVGAADAAPSGAFLSARGMEAHFAEAQAQGRAPRPVLPPGVDEIRISSNENPLGPGKAVLDAILGKFPEAGRYPFNSTPADADARRGHRREVQGQAGEHRPRRGLAGDPEERGARVHVADARSRHGARRRSRTARAIAKRYGHAARRDQSGLGVPAGRRADDRGASNGRRSRLLQQSRTIRPPPCTARRPLPTSSSASGKASPGHGDPDRRGVSRLRDRPVVPDGGAARARDAERLRRADVLEGVRHGGDAGRLRDRPWPRRIKPLAKLKMPYNVSVFGVAAAIAALSDHAAHRRGARAQHRGARVHGQGARGAGLQAGRLAGQLPLRGRRPAGEGLPRRVREVRASSSAATFRRSRRRTAGSRSGRWTRCRRRPRVPQRAASPTRRPPARKAGGGVMALTRRGFVQTVGIGAAAR